MAEGKPWHKGYYSEKKPSRKWWDSIFVEKKL